MSPIAYAQTDNVSLITRQIKVFLKKSQMNQKPEIDQEFEMDQTSSYKILKNLLRLPEREILIIMQKLREEGLEDQLINLTEREITSLSFFLDLEHKKSENPDPVKVSIDQVQEIRKSTVSNIQIILNKCKKFFNKIKKL